MPAYPGNAGSGQPQAVNRGTAMATWTIQPGGPYTLYRDEVVEMTGRWADCVRRALAAGSDDDLTDFGPTVAGQRLGDYRRRYNEDAAACGLPQVARG